jgi:hypothetical protein
LIIASVLAAIYFLAYFAVVPVPFVNEKLAKQILTVVSLCLGECAGGNAVRVGSPDAIGVR